MTPTEVQYKDESIRQFHHSINMRCLNTVIVNNPVPEAVFEDLQKFNFGESGTDSDDTSRRPTLIEQINIPDFKIIYHTLEDGLHSVPMNNFGDALEIINTKSENFDIAKCSTTVQQLINIEVDIAYVNRFNLTLSGTSPTSYIYASGKIVDLDVSFSTGDSMLYDNIPVTSVIAKRGSETNIVPTVEYSTKDVSTVVYMPLEWSDRFSRRANVNANRAYKFDKYILGPNEKVSTKIFDGSTYSLLHVCKGTAEIGGYTLEKQNFYEHDATTSIEITAGSEGCIVILSARVPSITLP